MPLKFALVFISSIFLSSVSHAAVSDVQGHLRSGLVQGSFSGAEEGSFSIASSLELEGEYFVGTKSSLLARATVSLDQSSGQFKYIYMGIGQRFYLFSRGRPSESSGDGVYFSQRPKLRYFLEYGLGLAQVQVRSLTQSLSVQSTIVELGLGGGAIYQFSNSFGVSLNLMGAKGYSVSSVSVDSTIIRGMIGVVGYF